MMKFLIVKDYSTPYSWGEQTIESFSANIYRTVPESTIDVCKAVDGEDVPDFTKYDAVILTGGSFDLINSTPTPWVADVLSRIRHLSKADSQTKLLGFCWGHQVTHFAFGGSLGLLPEGPRVGIEGISLTPDGQNMFGRDTLALHKYHKRVVTAPAQGFVELANGNEIFVSDNQKILTFQSHPEMTSTISQGLMDSDNGGYKVHSKSDTSVKLRDIHSPHDGAFVWDIIGGWLSK